MKIIASRLVGVALAIVLGASCSDRRDVSAAQELPPTPTTEEAEPPATIDPCLGEEQCPIGQLCQEYHCVVTPATETNPAFDPSLEEPTGEPPQEPPAEPARILLAAEPNAIDFGPVQVSGTKRLAVSLHNTGDKVVTLAQASITPSEAPFHIESMGTAPFWIRPGRARDIFVSYVPEQLGDHSARLQISSRAPQITVAVRGQATLP